MSRTINKAGMDLVKRFEGFRADAYLCPAQVWTIGYGHTAGVKEGQKITKKKAEQMLCEDLSAAESGVERFISVPLCDNQFAVLVSFVFNLGLGQLRSSTLRRVLNAGDYDSVPSELARWVRGGGKTLPGLVRRRAAEGELFLLADGDTISEEVPAMPQRVEVIGESIRIQIATHYLTDNVNLQHGSVDDRGDECYVRLTQNVPDGYVYDLQRDLRSMGIAKVGEPDGAFGSATEAAVQVFQKLASIEIDGEVDHGTKDKIMLWLEHGHTMNTLPDDEESDSIIQPDGMQLVSKRVPHFSQGDSRWASRTLGSGSTIRKKGCALACIAMILNHYGRNTTPKSIDIYLDEHNGYIGNSVKWDVAGQCGENNKSIKLKYARIKGSRKKLIDCLAERVRKNLPTMVRVDYRGDANLIYNHFVVCVGRTVEGEFIMNDPATRSGDGYVGNSAENIIQQTSRNSGYNIIQLDYYDPV